MFLAPHKKRYASVANYRARSQGAAAREAIVQVPFFSVVTPTPDGLRANARVVNAQSDGTDEDFWMGWFLTPRIGRKAGEIQATGRITLAYQHDSGKVYVALSGPAKLIDDREEVDRRFRGSAHDDPQGVTAASLIAVKVTADNLERHVRGVTAEPWGRGRTTRPRHQQDMAPRLK
jgi:general stress protein 26